MHIHKRVASMISPVSRRRSDWSPNAVPGASRPRALQRVGQRHTLLADPAGSVVAAGRAPRAVRADRCSPQAAGSAARDVRDVAHPCGRCHASGPRIAESPQCSPAEHPRQHPTARRPASTSCRSTTASAAHRAGTRSQCRDDGRQIVGQAPGEHRSILLIEHGHDAVVGVQVNPRIQFHVGLLRGCHRLNRNPNDRPVNGGRPRGLDVYQLPGTAANGWSRPSPVVRDRLLVYKLIRPWASSVHGGPMRCPATA